MASDPTPSEHGSRELSTATRQPLHLEEGVPRCHGEVRMDGEGGWVMEGGKKGDRRDTRRRRNGIADSISVAKRKLLSWDRRDVIFLSRLC